MKQLFSILLIFSILLGIVSCDKLNFGFDQNKTEDGSTQATTESTMEQVITTEEIITDEETDKMKLTTYPLSSETKGIKVLGERYLASKTQLNCDWTGSGLEMDVKHGGGDISFTVSASDNCYFRAYVDGSEWKNAEDSVYFTVGTSKTSIVLKGVPEGEHRIKLIKVTGYTLARAQLYDVTFVGYIKETAPAANKTYIEFVGDSICCAWGTIGSKDGAYTGQDGTLAYPMMVSNALNADYSVTALSGQGLLCGYPGMVKGYLYESALRSTEEQYSFARQADIVVINIGTNDYNYKGDLNISEDQFKMTYLNFIKTVSEKNGEDCIIYCLYNTMNNTFAQAILGAVKEFGGAAKSVYALEMKRAASGHPTIQENQEYTAFLLDILKEDVE